MNKSFKIAIGATLLGGVLFAATAAIAACLSISDDEDYDDIDDLFLAKEEIDAINSKEKIDTLIKENIELTKHNKLLLEEIEHLKQQFPEAKIDKE